MPTRDLALAALEMHHQVASALLGGGGKEEVLRQVLDAIRRGLNWQLGILFEVDQTNEVLQVTCVSQAPGMKLGASEAALHALKLRCGQGLPGRVWRDKAPLFRHEPHLDDGWRASAALAFPDLGSVLLFPVATAKAVHGVVALFSRDLQPPARELHKTWETLGHQVGQYFDGLRTEGALRNAVVASEARFQTLFRANIVGIVVADFNGTIRESNDEYLRIVGYSREELDKGLVDWRPLTPPEWRQADQAAIEQLCSTGFCLPYRKEYLRRDGVRVPVVIGAALLDRARGEAVCFVQDDTLRRQAERMLEDVNRDLERRVRERTASLETSEERAGQVAVELARSEHRLRTLATHLQSVREEERTQLAREIHDVLGQELTGLKMDAAWVVRRLKQPEISRETVIGRLATMDTAIDSAITTVRRIATDLRPGVLDDLGLVSALEWQARDYEQRSGLTVTFTAPAEEVSVDRARATALFRIFQELLTNIARHAQARTVEVALAVGGDRLVLEVRDDGRGISEVELSTLQSLGLLGMRERAASLGGAFSIVGEPGKGTFARVELPKLAGSAS